MIRYALLCDAGHDFESWFRSSDDFDSQLRRGFLACPVCQSQTVTKQIMAPRLARTDRQEAQSAPEDQKLALVSQQEQALRAMLAELRAHVTANAENVGREFAEEARKIHYGEVEQRSIYGEASPEEVRALSEEGVDFHPLPVLPEDRN